MVAYKISVQGRVQGVGYRWFALRNAQRLNIQGYVKNLYSGDVEVFAQGEEPMIAEFIHILRQGPSFSQVTDLEILEQDINNNLKEFKVDF